MKPPPLPRPQPDLGDANLENRIFFLQIIRVGSWGLSFLWVFSFYVCFQTHRPVHLVCFVGIFGVALIGIAIYSTIMTRVRRKELERLIEVKKVMLL